MLGLAVAYLWGKDRGRKQAAAADEAAGSGLGVIGFCAVSGTVLAGMSGGDDAVGAGFGWGLAVGVTVWVIVVAWLSGRGWGILATGTVLGAWIGYFVSGNWDGVWLGAGCGLAVWLGWLVSLRIAAAHIEPIMVEADDDA